MWYVNFVAHGRQVRVSTGCTDKESAQALVESYRGGDLAGPRFEVNPKHLIKMIERSRYRNRKKGVPFALTMGLMRELAERCGGYCEVSGHRLEDEGPFRPSLDRINPKVGYVPGNVRIVCLITNTAMLHYGEASFAELAISYCRRIGIVDPALGPESPAPSNPP